MITTTFSSVYQACLRAWGRDPDTANLTAAEEELYADRINLAVKEGFQHAFWPECMLVEQRYFRAAYAAGTTYALAAEVYYGGNYYTSLQAGNTGHTPGITASVLWWVLTTSLDRYVGWEQTGATKIGTPKDAWQRNPRVSRYPGPVPFTLSENGVQFTDLAPVSIYLEFRIRPPKFTRVDWSGAITYAAGALVYYDTTGECYTSVAGSNTNHAPTDTTYWTKVDLPAFLEDYIPLRVKVDTLQDDGQEDKKNTALDNANQELDRQLRVQFRQPGQYVTAKVRTYGG